MAAETLRPGLFVRPAVVLLGVLSFLAAVIMIVAAVAPGKSRAPAYVGVIGVFLLVFVAFSIRGLMIGVSVANGALVARSFFDTRRVPTEQITNIGFRGRPGAYGIEEWVAYVSVRDGTGFWLWATEAGRTSGPPNRTVSDRLMRFCYAHRLPLTEPNHQVS